MVRKSERRESETEEGTAGAKIVECEWGIITIIDSSNPKDHDAHNVFIL